MLYLVWRRAKTPCKVAGMGMGNRAYVHHLDQSVK